MDELEYAKMLLKFSLQMFDDAAIADDACVGYKDRQLLINEINAFLGLPSEDIQANWREGGVSEEFIEWRRKR